MADISKIKLPDGNTYDVKDTSKSSATNWVNGSATGSVRTVGSKAEGSSYTIGTYAIAEGYDTKASGDYGSHAEGASTVASANGAHAEGLSTTSSNYGSHAEGVSTTASGLYSHAEGYQTIAEGEAAHAEGAAAKAYSKYSHAEGMNTEAYGRSQHVFGENNIVDSAQSSTNRATYVEIVGNGTDSSNLHNARTLDWSGNEVLAGKLTVGVAGTNSLDVATIGQLPTKTSDLTNDSGFITTDSDEKVKITSTSATNRYYLTFLDTGNTPITKGLNVHVGNLVYKNDGTTTAIEIGSSLFKGAIHLKTAIGGAYGVSIEPGSLTSSRVVTLPDKDGTIALTSDIPDVSGFITSETDPVFSASAAAGITSTDISNWNAKVSDDKTWNGVSLTKSENTGGTPLYATILAATSATGASLLKITQTPTGGKIAQYDNSAYLHSTTPSANDNSTKVATTAYVDGAIPTVPTKTSDLTNDSGFITGYTETDPVFTASAAHGISTTDITNWNSKQAALVSGTNIKTVNGNSLLGSGNLTITGGSQVQIVRWSENLTTT